METAVGDLKSETTDGLKCSSDIKNLITSIGTSTTESNNYANFNSNVFSTKKLQF